MDWRRDWPKINTRGDEGCVGELGGDCWQLLWPWNSHCPSDQWVLWSVPFLAISLYKGSWQCSKSRSLKVGRNRWKAQMGRWRRGREATRPGTNMAEREHDSERYKRGSRAARGSGARVCVRKDGAKEAISGLLWRQNWRPQHKCKLFRGNIY